MVKVKMTSAELSLLRSHGDRGNLTFCNAAIFPVLPSGACLYSRTLDISIPL